MILIVVHACMYIINVRAVYSLTVQVYCYSASAYHCSFLQDWIGWHENAGTYLCSISCVGIYN